MFCYGFPKGLIWPKLRLPIGATQAFSHDLTRASTFDDEYKGEIITRPPSGKSAEFPDWFNTAIAGGEDVLEIEQYRNGKLAGHAYYTDKKAYGKFGIMEFALIAEIDRIIQSLNESEILVFIESNGQIPTQIARLNVETCELLPLGDAKNPFYKDMFNPLDKDFPKIAPIAITIKPSINYRNSLVEITMNGSPISRGLETTSFSVNANILESMSAAYGYSLGLLDNLAKLKGITTPELVKYAKDIYAASHKELQDLSLDFVQPKDFLNIAMGDSKLIGRYRESSKAIIGNTFDEIKRCLSGYCEKGTIVISEWEDDYDKARYHDILLVEKDEVTKSLLSNEMVTDWVLKNIEYIGYMKQISQLTKAMVHTPDSFMNVGNIEIDSAGDIIHHASRVAAVTEVLAYIGVADKSMEKDAQAFFDTTQSQNNISQYSITLESITYRKSFEELSDTPFDIVL